MTDPYVTSTLSPNDWEWWFSPWHGLISCGSCAALMQANAPCPVCGMDYSKNPPTTIVSSGGRMIEARQAFAGAIGWPEYVMLQLIHSEWLKPSLLGNLAHLREEDRPSGRTGVVIMFWTYYEMLMDRFFSAATRSLPPRISEDLLKRYGLIGRRLDQLYKVLFDSSFHHDFTSVASEDVYAFLIQLQDRRNAFIHGGKQSITDGLVISVAQMYPQVQQAWFKLFNLRCAVRK